MVEIVGGDNRTTFHSCRYTITVNEKKKIFQVCSWHVFQNPPVQFHAYSPVSLVTRRRLNTLPQIVLVDLIIQYIASNLFECVNMNGTAKSSVYCSKTQRDKVRWRGGQNQAEGRIQESSIKGQK